MSDTQALGRSRVGIVTGPLDTSGGAERSRGGYLDVLGPQADPRLIAHATHVALGGFDDPLIAQSTEPALTTVHQPLDQVGREMAPVLLAMIDGGVPAALTLPVELVRRASA
ncbi:substrate-binding domain-containing protein [Micromonospora rifamycinica]|uniref:substrate-binding domain-containing protein n=1 Tax=Micromonospora rifamycinica TaxID=291594 RepID=UPI003418F34A